jgi:uncharacterized membrane protein YhaH (DUF805 family)
MAFLMNFVVSAIIGVVATVLKLNVLSTLYSLAVLIPGLAIAVRRLQDAGHTWKSLLLYLIPLVGWIIVLVRLCKKSIPMDEHADVIDVESVSVDL